MRPGSPLAPLVARPGHADLWTALRTGQEVVWTGLAKRYPDSQLPSVEGMGDAEADNRLFRKKDNTMRVAAVLALVEAKSPAALNALKELADDKDKEVRETATRALAQIGR